MPSLEAGGVSLDVTVFLGAPGSGKGTQAKRLSETAGFVHLSTGDMLRAAIKNQSTVGKKVQAIVDRGELVPDETMIELIEAELEILPENQKVILDGFPRSAPQAEALAKSSVAVVKRVVYLKVPETVLIKRLTGRRMCSGCGKSFHMIYFPPPRDMRCDHCQSEIIQRKDDGEDVVANRLEVYREQTEPLLDFYRRQNKLKEINGDSQISEVQNKLLELIHGSN